MPSPSVKAKEALKKPPAAKSLRSRWIPDGDDTPKVNASINQFFDTKIGTSLQKLLDWPLHMLAIYQVIRIVIVSIG